MCGIAGIYSRDPAILGRIRSMTEIQAHRGPDGMGHLLLGAEARLGHADAPEPRPGDWLALGHRRLAILDCTPAGVQPMASPDRRDWITYNGEIYNYVELRQELAALGFAFATGTDTEVVLASYRAWGAKCFERFNGMWAIALWDGERQRLVLSRDRFGVKPLFYARVPGALVFASEIKGILAAGRIVPRLNPDVAIDYLKWSMVNHRNDSFFDGIQSFPPGHCAAVDDTLAVSPQAFWTLAAPVSEDPVDMPAAAQQFAALFRDAVRLRLRSDVPVGSCLSGGLDSSAIVCQANELRGTGAGPLHTFNSASADPRFDERAWAERVNRQVGAAAHYVFPDAASFERDLDALIWHQEEPFTTASIYAQWRVMQAARKAGIPVLLDGQGADEGLCGYRKFYLFHLRALLRSLRWGRVARELVGLVSHGDRGLLRWREGARYLPAFMRRRLPQADRFLRLELGPAWSDSRLPLQGAGSLVQRQIDDLLRFSVPSLLRYEDRNSMAWSIESRVPFLDYRLVEWLIRAPAQVKLDSGRTKAVMRRALRGLVPDAILDRRDKMGFVTAQEVWLRGPLRQAVEACFADPDFPLARLADGRSLLKGFRNWADGGSGVPHGEFFKFFLLARWARRFDVQC